MNTNIKLIATDVDGTLIKDSSREVYDELIEVIQKLIDKGIIFVIASGRQYGSIRRMFERTNRPLNFIADNGAHIILSGNDYAVTEMKRNDVEEIMTDLREMYKMGCDVVFSTPNGSLLETNNEDFIKWIKESYRNNVTIVEDVLAEDVTTIKIAVHKEGSLREYGESVLIPKWKDRVKVTMAGNEWVDFMDQSVDKGNALQKVQKALGISKDETMVFGDNNNDIGLIMNATESYAVENAVPELKAVAKYICPDYTKKGVCQVLNQLLDELNASEA